MTKKELIIKSMDDKLALDIKVINFQNKSPFYDYFIIGTALNDKMSEAIGRNVVKTANLNGYKVNKIESSANGDWTLVDLDDIIVHIFTQQARNFYSLEKLWSDLPIEEIVL